MDRLNQLLEFLNDNPADPFIKYCLALEYIKKDDIEKGLFYFENLVRDNPEYVGTYYHLGKLYEKLKRKADAEKIYTEGLDIARKVNDNHSYAELMNALNELVNDYTVEFDN